MSQESFSRRLGVGVEAAKITIRNDAPEAVRDGVLMIAKAEVGLGPTPLRTILCGVLRKRPDEYNWTDYPNVWSECLQLIEAAPWYRVYDFAEGIYRHLASSTDSERAGRFERLLNDHFIENGVGWQMVDGLFQARGEEGFEAAIREAPKNLEAAGLPTAAVEIHEAIKDLSRRPEPDLTGAIQHAVAAVECAAREAAGGQSATLGKILKSYPDLFPKPLDIALDKLWGFASEEGRHLYEGRDPGHAEAELVVTVAAGACSYLAAKIRSREAT